MTTRIFTTFVAAIMTMSTMSAHNQNSTNTTASASVQKEHVQKMSIEILGTEGNKYVYNMDSKGRVVNRISYKLNKINGKWLPISAYSVFYGDGENILTYAEYNPISNAFNCNAQQKSFNANDFPELIRVPQITEK